MRVSPPWMVLRAAPHSLVTPPGHNLLSNQTKRLSDQPKQMHNNITYNNLFFEINYSNKLEIRDKLVSIYSINCRSVTFIEEVIA